MAILLGCLVILVLISINYAKALRSLQQKQLASDDSTAMARFLATLVEQMQTASTAEASNGIKNAIISAVRESVFTHFCITIFDLGPSDAETGTIFCDTSTDNSAPTNQQTKLFEEASAELEKASNSKIATFKFYSTNPNGVLSTMMAAVAKADGSSSPSEPAKLVVVRSS